MLKGVNSQLENNPKKEDAIELDIPTTTPDIHFYYFIGRLNPPHDGHITALKLLIEKALATSNIPPLILLGSGPGKIPTLDNPISFDLKRRFIMYKLLQLGLEIDENIIKEMDKPATQVSQYIIANNDPEIQYNKISITHIAGNKGDDAKKLGFVLDAAKKTAESNAIASTIEAKTLPITPEQSKIAMELEQPAPAMSATEIRKSVYSNYLAESSFDEWDHIYGGFYGDMAREIYEAILGQAKTQSAEELRTYINTGALPSKKGNAVVFAHRNGGIKLHLHTKTSDDISVVKNCIVRKKKLCEPSDRIMYPL